MSEREELIRILDTEGAQAGDCGHEPGNITDCPNDCEQILEGYAEAILAAGYRKVDVESTVVSSTFSGVILGITDGLPPVMLDGLERPEDVRNLFSELQRRLAITRLKYYIEVLEGSE